VDLWDHHTGKNSKSPHLIGIDKGILHLVSKPECLIDNQDKGTSIGIIKGSSPRTDWDVFLVG